MDVDARLEAAVADTFWLPDWATVVDRPEIRYTRSPRDQHALNQVLRVRADLADLPAVVDEVSAAHRAVTSRWLLGRDSQDPRLDPLLESGGWAFEYVHHARAISSEARIAHPTVGVTVRAVTDTTTLVDCIRTCEAAFDKSPADLAPERLADELFQLTRPAAQVHRFVAYDDATGRPMASGGLNVFPRLRVAFLWGGGTAPDFRHRGAYRAVVAARLERAARTGCAMVGIYAREGTSDPIMAALGFARHGTMVTWARAPGSVA